MCVCVLVHARGDQRTPFKSHFFPSTIWVLGIKSGRQTWQQVSLPAEPSCWLKILIFGDVVSCWAWSSLLWLAWLAIKLLGSTCLRPPVLGLQAVWSCLTFYGLRTWTLALRASTLAPGALPTDFYILWIYHLSDTWFTNIALVFGLFSLSKTSFEE